MTALAANRDTPQIDTTVIPETGSLPLAAAAKIYSGSMVASDASGNAVPASALQTLTVVGVAPSLVDNTGGSAGALTTVFKRGAFPFNMGAGADAITIANRMALCYASDDNTVNLTDAGGTRPVAGYILDVVGTQVTVLVGLPVAGVSQSGLQAGDMIVHRARGMVTTNVAALATFSSVAGGTILDGVTYVAGDRVFLAGQTAGAQNGIYVVGTVAAGSAPLTRAADFDSALLGEVAPTVIVTVSEGFTGANTIFLCTNAGAIVIGTTALTFAFLATTSTVETSTYKARAIVTANITTLGGAGTFAGVAGGSTTNSDGVTCVAGDIVLLTAQTTPAQNGPYVVGTVAAGTAPLSRPAWFAPGSTQASGFKLLVGGEGTLYKNTDWKAFVAASSFVVDTTDGKFYPESVTWQAALVAGISTAGVGATAGAPANLPVFSAKSNLLIQRLTPNTTAATVMYSLNGAPTPGVPGVGAISGFATVAAGTINNADISTMAFTLINQI